MSALNIDFYSIISNFSKNIYFYFYKIKATFYPGMDDTLDDKLMLIPNRINKVTLTVDLNY